MRRRRALGVTFGLSMAIHVGCILRLYALHAPARPPMVTDSDIWIGIPALGMVAVLTVTSLDALKRRLSPAAWRRLHATGIWIVWAIFFLCLVDSVGRKTTAHPVLAYHLFIAVLAGAAGLRVAALGAPLSAPPWISPASAACRWSASCAASPLTTSRRWPRR
ncbi:MAG: ferric reductase-like transmembrane domain-containing protein [Candidatus Binatia bacterium]